MTDTPNRPPHRTTILRCIRDRAHLAGAEAVILKKEADALAAGPLPATINDYTDDQPFRALLLATQAHSARQRYYRELEAIDLILGNTPSPFADLSTRAHQPAPPAEGEVQP